MLTKEVSKVLLFDIAILT